MEGEFVSKEYLGICLVGVCKPKLSVLAGITAVVERTGIG